MTQAGDERAQFNDDFGRKNTQCIGTGIKTFERRAIAEDDLMLVEKYMKIGYAFLAIGCACRSRELRKMLGTRQAGNSSCLVTVEVHTVLRRHKGVGMQAIET